MRQPRGLRICAGTLDDMTDSKEQDRKTTLSLGGSKGKLELRKGADGNQVRQSFSHGRSKTVQVEVKRKRSLEKAVDRGPAGDLADGGAAGAPICRRRWILGQIPAWRRQGRRIRRAHTDNR